MAELATVVAISEFGGDGGGVLPTVREYNRVVRSLRSLWRLDAPLPPGSPQYLANE